MLTFTHIFDEAQDTCFFAFCHPYTYTDLQTHLFIAEGKLQQSAARSTLSPRPVVYSKVPAAQESSSASVGQGGSKLLFYYRTKLCDTLAGNRCDLLVISSLDNVQLRENDPAVGASVSDFSDPAPPSGVTNAPIQMPTPPLSRSSTPSSQRSPSPSTSARSVKASAMDYYPIPGLATPKSVPHIIISARVHPGETTASWSMQGFLDFILSNHLKAQELREKFVFIIVPMLNPDGVINGNNRTSLSGHDLNRNWRCPDPVRHPTIHHLKTVAQNLVDRTSHEVLMYLDLHGHSRQKGAFTYGCLPDKDDIQVRSALLCVYGVCMICFCCDRLGTSSLFPLSQQTLTWCMCHCSSKFENFSRPPPRCPLCLGRAVALQRRAKPLSLGNPAAAL